MKKSIKRMLAMVMVVAMIVALGVSSAYAATPDINASGVYGSTTSTLTEGVNLKKSIVFINEDGVGVYEPNITYSYAVSSPASVTATITDSDNNVAAVRVGPANGLSCPATVSFSAANNIVTSSAAGVEVSKNIPLSVDLTKFASAGVYRYKITETVAAADLETAAIVRSNDYVSERYVDVYIKNNNGALEVYGFTCFEGNDNTSLTAASSNKNAGFVKGSDLSDVDVYYTYNLSVKKVITGTLADMIHEFPFSISVGGQDSTAKYQYKLADAAANTDALLNGAAITQNLGHNKVIEIYGLPGNATINVTETNDTADAYALTISNDKSGSVNTFAAAIAAGATASMKDAAVVITDYSASSVATVAAATQAYGAIEFENSLDAVSPTGLLIRFAPYVIMFGMAWLFVIASKNTKEEKKASAAI